MAKKKEDVRKQSWETFKDNGLLWWINTILHIFGWAIVYDYDDDNRIINVYPARVSYRGFDEKTTKKGFKKISKYMRNNAKQLYKESQE